MRDGEKDLLSANWLVLGVVALAILCWLAETLLKEGLLIREGTTIVGRLLPLSEPHELWHPIRYVRYHCSEHIQQAQAGGEGVTEEQRAVPRPRPELFRRQDSLYRVLGYDLAPDGRLEASGGLAVMSEDSRKLVAKVPFCCADLGIMIKANPSRGGGAKLRASRQGSRVAVSLVVLVSSPRSRYKGNPNAANSGKVRRANDPPVANLPRSEPV